MGEVLKFRRPRRKSHPLAPAECGTILLFTGIWHARQVDAESSRRPGRSPRAQRPGAKLTGTGSRRKTPGPAGGSQPASSLTERGGPSPREPARLTPTLSPSSDRSEDQSSMRGRPGLQKKRPEPSCPDRLDGSRFP